MTDEQKKGNSKTKRKIDAIANFSEACDSAAKRAKKEEEITMLDDFPSDVKKVILLWLKEDAWVMKVSKFWYKLYYEATETILIKTEVGVRLLESILDEFHTKSSQITNLAVWCSSKEFVQPINDSIFSKISLFKSTLNKVIIGKGVGSMACTDESFTQIYQCVNLQVIEIDYANLSFDAFKGIENLSKLRILRIRGLQNDKPNQDISVFERIKNLTRLQRLGLWVVKGSINFEDTIHLKKLELLTEIIISNVSISSNPDACFDMICKKKFINHLGFFLNSSLLSNDIWSSNFSTIVKMQKLSSLHLGAWSFQHGDPLVLKNNKNLKTLSLSCLLVPRLIFEGVTTSNITFLRFCTCNIAGVNFASFKKCKNLEQFEMDNVVDINDHHILEISKHENLSSLTLKNLPAITNRAISLLLDMLNLRSIQIKACQQITKDAIIHIQNNHLNCSLGMLKIDFEPYINQGEIIG
jgi:hypothetical protein